MGRSCAEAMNALFSFRVLFDDCFADAAVDFLPAPLARPALLAAGLLFVT